MNRFCLLAFGLLAGLVPLGECLAQEQSPEPLDVGSRRELFVDGALVGKLSGEARWQLHQPTPQEIVLVHDAPWEGSGSGYHSVFHDGERYRMYYKAWHLDVTAERVTTNSHPGYCCYAESDDGIHWRKPNLGLHEFKGSKDNNITIATEKMGAAQLDAAHPAVFLDENPDAPLEARYKAILRSNGPHGLLALKSADGLRWSLMQETPVLTDGAFDSQNLAFWDPVRKEYRAYWRYFTAGVADDKEWKPAGKRDIRTATSKDMLTWSEGQNLVYENSPSEHLYTNQVAPYHRAPHLLLGFPTRYIERGWSDSMKALPELEHRQWRAASVERFGTAITEALFMASRDGVHFKRWEDAFLPPGIERPGTWNYGHQYLAWRPVETKSALEGAPNELSFYASESYWTGNSSAVRRYTLRLDGFASISAPMAGGELVTNPIRFEGKELKLNFASQASGDLRVEIQDPSGKPLPGFSLEDCPPIFGDSIERTVTWKSGGDVSSLAGKPVRLRFALRGADLYAFQFQ